MPPPSGSPAVTAVDSAVGDRPLTARSIVLSTLLGYQPPELPVRTLVRVGDLFGIAESTVRVALVRMVADGDVTADAGVYRLTGRLLDRHSHRGEIHSPPVRHARGAWRMAVVTAAARPLTARVTLRRAMDSARMAELREGVWLRPANLTGGLPDTVRTQCTVFTTRPEDPAALAARLWDLDAWAGQAATLLAALDGPLDLRGEFLLSTRTIRHLQTDPVLPLDLLPAHWPGAALRHRYAEFEADFAARLRSFGDA